MAFIQFQLRRGTESEWTSANPTLAAGEMGVETDTGNFKIGDGTTAWNTLDYGGLAGATGPTGATGPEGPEGPVGQGLELKGVLDNEGELPSSEQQVGDAYLIGTVLYVWDGTEFISADLQGPQGEPGTSGEAGGFAFEGEWSENQAYSEGDIVAVSDATDGQNSLVNGHLSLYRAKQEFQFGSPDPRSFSDQWEFVAGFERTNTIFTYVGTKDPEVDQLENFNVFNQGAGTGLSFFANGQVIPFAQETNFDAPPIGTVFADPIAWSAGEYASGLLVEYTFNTNTLVFVSNTTTSSEPTQSGDWDFVDVNPRFVNSIPLGNLSDLSNVFIDPQFLNNGDVLTYNGQFQVWQPQPSGGGGSGSFTYGGWEVDFGDGETFVSNINDTDQTINSVQLLRPGVVDVTLAVWDGQDPSDARIVEYVYYVNGTFATEELSENVLAASTNLTDIDLELVIGEDQNEFIFNVIDVKLTHNSNRDNTTLAVFVTVQPRGAATLAPDNFNPGS